jgi:hypothetical protein
MLQTRETLAEREQETEILIFRQAVEGEELARLGRTAEQAEQAMPAMVGQVPLTRLQELRSLALVVEAVLLTVGQGFKAVVVPVVEVPAPDLGQVGLEQRTLGQVGEVGQPAVLGVPVL